MFGLYFGKYLVEMNKISQTQFEDAIMQQQKTRVKLGLIAVAEKLLTTKQAEEINDIQKKLDRRFGDIAIEKGYLLNEEVTHLLNMQGNPYLQFVQVLTENNILTIQEIESNLEDYKKANGFTDSDIDSLKSGDIDRIIPIFVNTSDAISGECIRVILRSIVRFISNNISLHKAYTVKEHSFETLATQRMVGDHKLMIGLAGHANSLLAVSNPFAKEDFSTIDEDAFDAVCEFINCANGLFASKLSQEEIHIDMTPPEFYTDKKLSAEKNIIVVPIMINGQQVDLIVAIDTEVVIN